MHRRFFVILCAAMVQADSFPACSNADFGQPDTEPDVAAASADELFQAGEFASAGKLYADTVARDQQNYHAALRLGDIALLANRLDQAWWDTSSFGTAR